MPVTMEGLTSIDFGKSIGAQVQRFTREVAMRALREEVAKGFDNEPVVITDGVPRRDPDQVKPFGKIEWARRGNMADAVLWALNELQKASPVLTGRYASSHTVLLNGAEITGNIRAALQGVKETDRVQIVNPQPYARKIEGATASKKTGRKKRAGSSRQAKNGVYRKVLRALVNRYGRAMFFEFTYVKLNTGVKVWGAQGGGRNRKRILRDQVYPVLKFFIKPTGLPN